jgi:hypothetical protein
MSIETSYKPVDAKRKSMTHWQISIFYFSAMFIYALPLILNNYPYHDDNLRSVLASTRWYEEGRVVADALISLLTFTAAAPAVFPLTLLAGMAVMAYSLQRLAIHWFAAPNLTQCAILLPLWYNPYFLQLLSYQYDCFTASVGIALMVLAVSLSPQVRLFQLARASVLVAAGISTYQPTLNLYIGLACLDILQCVHKQPGTFRAFHTAMYHLKVLVGAGLIYFATSYQLIVRDRGGLKWPSAEEWYTRIILLADKFLMFVSSANFIMFVLLAVCSVGGVAIILMRIRKAPQSAYSRLLDVSLCLGSLLGLFFSVGGILLLVSKFEANLVARVLIGGSPLLVGLLFLVYIFWLYIYEKIALIVWVPLFCFLSFSFAYGQVMRDKKDVEAFTRTLLSADLIENPQIAAAKQIIIDFDKYNGIYQPSCVDAVLPAMFYIFNNTYFLLPEQLVKWGFANIEAGKKPAALDTPVLIRSLYNVYLQKDVAYIVFVKAGGPVVCHPTEE